MKTAALIFYQVGALATFVYLAIFHFHYNWWNWIVAVPTSLFLAEVWPIYWLLILPLSHYMIGPLLRG